PSRASSTASHLQPTDTLTKPLKDYGKSYLRSTPNCPTSGAPTRSSVGSTSGPMWASSAFAVG
ncbi:MAG: hypothetical protein ACREBR_00030, partial [bacterium]